MTAAGGVAELGIDGQLGTVTVRGSAPAVQSCVRLISLLDSAERPADDGTRLVSLAGAKPTDVRRLVEAIRTGSQPGRRRQRPDTEDSSTIAIPREPLVAMLFQKPDKQPEGAPAETTPADAEQPPPPPGKKIIAADQPDDDAGLIGPVQIELLDGLDVLVVRGHRRDVDRVVEIINQVERLSAVTQPAIEVYHLLHVDCEALAALVEELYAEVFFARQGDVSITALEKPNALLLIGRRECVNTVLDLVGRLDRPVDPKSQFRVFQLKHAPVETVRTMVDEFFAERGGLGARFQVTIDFRSNSLILHASPRDLAEVAELINKIDISTSQAVNELRVIHLENSLAEELAPILQEAINSQGNRRTGTARTATSGQQRTGGATGQQMEPKSAMLRFITIDKDGRRNWNSGILTDVRITADPRANAILVSAPANSMALIEALVRQLDQLPGAEAQIKVFTLINGDAVSLLEVLETLFSQTRGTDQPLVRTGAGEGDSSLVSLRFAVDMRTNSIIASGSKGDLGVVEAILLRLDESGARQRKSSVYRLKNAPAEDVATAINEFLRSERQVQEVTTEMMSPFEQIEREVVVVPERVSNSLIVSATPRFYEEIAELIEKLDEQPPMVMIQVLIIEVALGAADEFGVELGLQDSLLFDRSVLGDIITTTQTTYDAFGNPTSQNETIVSASNAPGFNFNNQPLGNSGSTQAMQAAQQFAGQALSSFAVGRVNSELGYGGLVLSGTSRSVNVLIRALQENRRTEVLSRPQIMTLDNQPAFIQVGERVPRISGSQVNQSGQINNIVLENVGLILGVTPRISPDNLVVMEIDAEKSAVGPIAEGIPVSISTYSGEVIKSPRIETTTAQTTVSALTGQTVVLGGLITKEKTTIHRRVPLLADAWLLGNLFRYDLETTKRKELIIIMTPHIVRTEQDAEAIKQVEMARINWCLSDSLDMHGDHAIRGHGTEWIDDDTPVIYPDGEPIEAPIEAPAELESEVPEAEPVPTPAGTSIEPGEEVPPEPPVQEPAVEAPGSSTGSQIRLRPVKQAGYQAGAQPGRVEQAVCSEYPPARYPNTGQYQPVEYEQPGPPVGIVR